jgi:polyisoprenoid-binding protein YceI
VTGVNVDVATQTVRPAAGRWVIDAGHAEVAFVGRHFMLTKVRGRFRGVEGHILVTDDLADSVVDVVIDISSVDSGDDARDEHLRSADLFDVARYPSGSFRSTSIRVDGSEGTLLGELTLKAVTRQVSLDVVFRGAVTDPWGGERVVFSGRGRLNREDWGLTWNMVLEAGGLLVSKEVDIEIELEAVRQDG